MRLIVVCPSGADPVGGVLALYELCNGMARRGHEIHLLHLPLWGREVTDPAQLDRYHFEDEIVHYLPGADPASVPSGDVVFGTGARPDLGLPVLFLQGVEVLHGGLEWSALRSRSLKLCVASWLVDIGATYGIDPAQMRVVPNGIDHGLYRRTRDLDDRPYDVAVRCSLHPSKGWDVAVRAMTRARREVPDLRAVAYGTVRPDGDLPDWIDVVIDPAPELLVTEVYNRSRTFLLPSDHEGFGLPAVEAMASGCALVTTDNGGSREYATQGETALVAAPRDDTTLAEHLVALRRDDGLRRRLADAGTATARRFTWDASAEATEAHLEAYVADPERFLVAPHPEGNKDLPYGLRAARTLAATVPPGVDPHPDPG